MEDHLQQHATCVVKKQEAVRVGNLVVLAQPDQAALDRQKQLFLTRAYHISGTQHFVVCQKPMSRQTVLLHIFGQAEIDADLICFIENELSSFGFIPTAREFGATLFAVLASTFPSPRHQPAIWQRFCLNTLAKLREQTAHPLNPSPTVSYIAPFAAVYRRIFELFVGQSVLDVGCSFGFLPVLLAEKFPDAHVVGCDKSADAIGFSSDLARVAGVQHSTFTLQNVLAPGFSHSGCFDTVTAIHLLEHLPEEQLAQAFEHLLQVTRHRLIVAVPYEQQAAVVYGHEQVFSREKLEKWGIWCTETLGGTARSWCEEVAGGLLVVDRLSSEE